MEKSFFFNFPTGACRFLQQQKIIHSLFTHSLYLSELKYIERTCFAVIWFAYLFAVILFAYLLHE